jgi:hypothetical protein
MYFASKPTQIANWRPGSTAQSEKCDARHIPEGIVRTSYLVGGMIKKAKGGYKVLSESTGKNLGGPYKTLEEAKKRLRQVEFFKRRKG